MDYINRWLAVVYPKQPFIDWANYLPDADKDVALDDFRSDCMCLLIPDYDTEDEAREYINQMYEDIFEEELFGWCTNEDWWPKTRTLEVFWQWFDVVFHSTVTDCVDEPIVTEEF